MAPLPIRLTTCCVFRSCQFILVTLIAIVITLAGLLEFLGKFDISFEYVNDQDDIVHNALLHHPYLANIIVMSISLLDRI